MERFGHACGTRKLFAGTPKPKPRMFIYISSIYVHICTYNKYICIYNRSTRELFAGTTKAEGGGRPPGYGGFVPAAAAAVGGVGGPSTITARAAEHSRDHLNTQTKKCADIYNKYIHIYNKCTPSI